MPYRLATPQQSSFSVSYFVCAVKYFYGAQKILIVFFGKSAIVSVVQNAPVAQLDRVSASEAEGRGFESRRAHQLKKILERGFFCWGKTAGEEAAKALARAGLMRSALVPKIERLPRPCGARKFEFYYILKIILNRNHEEWRSRDEVIL